MQNIDSYGLITTSKGVRGKIFHSKDLAPVACFSKNLPRPALLGAVCEETPFLASKKSVFIREIRGCSSF
jgi:hypothetical protein